MHLDFPDYNIQPVNVFKKNKLISDFIQSDNNQNVNVKVVESFGEEWSKFNAFDQNEITKIGNEYFDILPSEIFSDQIKVLDVGCGTGRWTKYLCSKVRLIDAVDPSKAIFVADELLKDCLNVRLTKATSDTLPFENNTYELVMSIGVLHHIPDTLKAMNDCVAKVKPGGYFYTYLYYNLDKKGKLFKLLFSITDIIRRVVSKMPSNLKKFTCDLMAIFFYMPFVLFARALHFIQFKKLSDKIPLSYYKNKSFFIIRNDALDRFGTRLEQRFSRIQIETMMIESGLKEIKFSENKPYWHVIGKKIIK